MQDGKLSGVRKTLLERMNSIEDNSFQSLPTDVACDVYRRGVDGFNRIVDELKIPRRPEFPSSMYAIAAEILEVQNEN